MRRPEPTTPTRSGSHRGRNSHPYPLRSVDQLDQFDAYAGVGKISPWPLLMIAGTEAETKGFSDGAVSAAGETAELFEIDGATHVDLYDVEQYVAQAVEKLNTFFAKHLSS